MGNPAITAVKKALRVRRKMFALAQAKENALRDLAGYPPLMTWWETCTSGCLAAVRVVICRAFCPCWVGRFTFKAFFCPRTTCCGRCFYAGDYENEIFKNLLGFITGTFLTLLFYAWLCLQKDYPKFQAAIISCVMGAVLTLGMAFAHTVRCLVFLTLPSMFSKKGRSFLMMYAIVLVYSYPAANLSTNLKVMSDSTTCGQSLMLNETKKLIEMAKEPLSAMMDTLQDMYIHIKIFAKALVSAFKALLRAVLEIVAAIAMVFKWLYNLVDICNNKMGEPYKKCKKSFEDAYDDCRDSLGIFGFLCEIVTAASYLCHLARIGELLCAISGPIRSLVLNYVSKAATGRIVDLREMFFFSIEIDRRYSYSMNQTRSYSEIKEAIMAEIKAKINGYQDMLGFMDNVMMVSVFYVFTKAWRYRRGYLTKDGYDNYYITPQVHAIDERRRSLRRDSVFPLKEMEEWKYLGVFSWRLTRKEIRKLAKGMAMWGLVAYNAAFYLIGDYGLYWMLRMVSITLDVKTTASLPPFMQLHVQGDGPLADMYRTMVGLLDPLANSGLDIDTSACLPIPSTPDYVAYQTIIALFLICLILAIFEAYGLRLRRAVAACYYPKRERQRAVWLYNQILFKRVSFFRFARRQIRRQLKDDKEIQRMSIKGRIARQFPSMKRLMSWCGYKFKHCIVCALEGKPKDMDNFTHCTNYGCTAVYCNMCFDDMGNMCTLCMNPVDYGDLSDASEEIDSSEDDDVVSYKKRKAKERRAKQEARKKKENQKPKDFVTQFRKQMKKQHSSGQGGGGVDTGGGGGGGGGALEPLLGAESRGGGGGGGGGGTTSTESTSATEGQYDSSYQYRNKEDIPTSTARDSSSSPSPSRSSPSSPSTSLRGQNANRNWSGTHRQRPAPHYETLDIFNVDSSDADVVVVVDSQPQSGNRYCYSSEATVDI